VLDLERHTEQESQKTGGQYRDVERVDRDRGDELDEEVQDDDVDEQVGRPRPEELLVARDADQVAGRSRCA
jgi:hypothetical protein